MADLKVQRRGLSGSRRFGGKRGGKKGGKRAGAHFMDAAFEAYVRDLALHFWREVDDQVDVHGLSLDAALARTGRFGGDYGEIWSRHWSTITPDAVEQSGTPVYGLIETAVQGALQEEQETRRQRGEGTIEDTPRYQHFVSHALDRLFEEASGEIEDMDG